MSDHRPPVSARGVLDGDPAALAGLCDLRGPWVIAYCRAVCGPALAVDAAAAAFSAFRAAAVGAVHPLALNPDALLMAKAREAAAARAPDPSGGGPRPGDPLCPEVPRLLAGAAPGALLPADLHHLRRHLARCVACRGAQRAQREAERAYPHPPARSLPPITRQAIIAALRNAAPTGPPGRGPIRSRRPGAPPALRRRAARRRRPRRRPAPPPASRAPVPPAAGPTPPRRRRRRPSAPPRRRPAPPGARPRLPPAGARDVRDRPRRRPLRRAAPARPGRSAEEAPTGVIPVDRVAAALGYAASRRIRPAPRPSPRRPPSLRARLTGWLRRARLLAPVGVLVVALLVVLAIAGVFSAGRTAPVRPRARRPASAGPPRSRPPPPRPARPPPTGPACGRPTAAGRLRARAKAAGGRGRGGRQAQDGHTPPGAAATGSPTTAAGPATTPAAPAPRAPGVLASPAATAPP